MVKLNIPERFMVLTTLRDVQGNFVTLRALSELRINLHPTEEERKEYELSIEGNLAKWNTKALEEKEMEFPDIMFELVKKELTRLDKEEKLTDNHLSIYKKFVEGS